MLTFEMTSAAQTARLGRHVARALAPGSVLALWGGLGAGKTVFTQGLAQGLGVDVPVTSPTYTLLHIYEQGRLALYHFDLYRLENPAQAQAIGFDDYAYADGVCVIEWPTRLAQMLPERRVDVTIEKGEGDVRTVAIDDPFGQLQEEVRL
nr:tRNA (adenosine(37)-N6)-threonylcarbamoyltransferase complex ATPase subunit type 1 TsaE [Maliibacterium massiliense]